MKLLCCQLLLSIFWCSLAKDHKPDYNEAQDSLSQSELSETSASTSSSSSSYTSVKVNDYEPEPLEHPIKPSSSRSDMYLMQDVLPSKDLINLESPRASPRALPVRPSVLRPSSKRAISPEPSRPTEFKLISDRPTSSTESSSEDDTMQHILTELADRRLLRKKMRDEESQKERKKKENKNKSMALKKAAKKQVSKKAKAAVPKTSESVGESPSAFSRAIFTLEGLGLEGDRQLAFNLLLFFILFWVLLRPAEIHHHHYQDCALFQQAKQ